MNCNDKEEIEKFNNIFDPVLNYLRNPKKFQFYEEIIFLMENYIKCIDGINEQSAFVLKNIKLILEEDRTTSKIIFSFISTFLLYWKKNKAEKCLNLEDLFKEILLIIIMAIYLLYRLKPLMQ